MMWNGKDWKEGNKCASAVSLGKEGQPYCSPPGNNDSGYNTFCRIKAMHASFKTLYFIDKHVK